MKFIADVMLGRLAKRLRLLGHDVLYDSTLDDNALIRISLEEDRVILTRDTGLARRPLARNHLFIRDDNPGDQVGQVLSFLDGVSAFARSLPLTRCSVFNGPLTPLGKTDAQDLVPAHVFRTHDKFLHCVGCNRVYWRGTHTERMQVGQKGRKGTKRRG